MIRNGNPLLSVEGLGIAFGGLKAVNDVSFSVRPGEIASVIGPNGAGKSTFLSMVSRLLAMDGGTVTVDGLDVTRTPSCLLYTSPSPRDS